MKRKTGYALGTVFIPREYAMLSSPSEEREWQTARINYVIKATSAVAFGEVRPYGVSCLPRLAAWTLFPLATYCQETVAVHSWRLWFPDEDNGFYNWIGK